MDWLEVGDRVFAGRYRFYAQQIGVVLAGDDVLVIDTRSTPSQARELLNDVRALTRRPVTVVVNTHWHYDHTFGNHDFRPAAIWGHVRAAERLRRDGKATIAEVAAEVPAIADDIRKVTIDPPERTFEGRATVDLGGREIDLAYLGRGHTDGDIVVSVPDAAVTFVGDLLESGATPYFGDGYPLDWPDTVERLLPLATGTVVPGHGAVGDRTFAEAQLAALRGIVELARRVHAGELDLEAAIAASPFEPATSREPLERAAAQLRGELG